MNKTLCLQRSVVTTIEPTERAMQIAVMFGLSIDGTQTHTVIPPTTLSLCPGQLLFVTGVSGGGKSTMLRLISEALTQGDATPPDDNAPAPALIDLDTLSALPDTPLVEALACPEAAASAQRNRATLEQVTRWLSLAGLNDAAVMLRRPSELSVGQRHRLRLAQALGIAERSAEPWSVLLADEFASPLDRTTAHALARSTRRWVTRSGVCLVAATAHDDLLEPLNPDVLIEVGPGGECAVHQRPS